MNSLMNPSTTPASIVSLSLLDAQAIEGWSYMPESPDGPVHVRPIEPEDLEREREFVAGLSPHTAYRRLMSARTPTDEELRRWTQIDRSREGAVVATIIDGGRERQVGVARYVLDGPEGHADFAIVITDEWQRQGLGKRLLLALMALATQSGVRQLVGSTMSENRGMLALAHQLGFKLAKEPGAASTTNVSMWLR